MTTIRAPRAYLFDLDGTLVDTVGTRVDAWMETFPVFGIEPDREFVAPLMGSDGKLVARTVAERYGAPLAPGIDVEVDRVAGERFGELNQSPRALPGALAMLEFLDDADMPWAIATSSRPEEATASVESLGLRLLPMVIDGSDVEHAKPAPDLLLKGAERLGIDPQDAWNMGDAKWDMLAAKAAGMVPLGVTTGATGPTELRECGAVATFVNLDGLLDYVSSDALAPDRGTRELGD
jgi:beta-phosphoglucomutase-like phosphatase (HAD superfamily)